jgi:HAD superfamily hydrolase (TIGR01490 family)
LDSLKANIQVALFDLDHTILKVNSGKAFVIRAYKSGLLSAGQLAFAIGMIILYKMNVLHPLKVIKRLCIWVEGVSVSGMETLCKELVEKELIPAIRPQIISELQKLKGLGVPVVMLSSAIAPVCNRLAEHLEMTAVICTELGVINSFYTGQPEGNICFREEKLNRLKLFLSGTGFTLGDCCYYADSTDDIPVFESVGRAICINPDKKLKKLAMANQWVIHNFD